MLLTRIFLLSAALVTLPILPAHASIVTLTTLTSDSSSFSLNQGWWSDIYSSLDYAYNHDTGRIGGAELRSFYTFDLRNVNGKVTNATFKVMRGYQSGTVNLNLWDVSTPANAVNFNQGLNSAIFADLGTGSAYGSYKVVPGNYADRLELELNTQGVTDVRNNNGFFTIGATVNAAAGEFIFSSTGGDMSYLILEVAERNEVPEPTSFALLLAGVSSFVATRRRKKFK